LKVGENLRDANGRLSWEEHDVLSHHILKFEELRSSIMDSSPPTIYRTYRERFRYRRLRQDSNDPHMDRDEDVDKGPRILFGIMNFGESIRTASFAKKIPKLRRAITAQVEFMTAYNVPLKIRIPFSLEFYHVVADHSTRSNQDRIQDSQQRTECSQKQMTSAQERLEESQSRIEVQLKEILGSRRQGIPFMRNSLDASSPEGHQTWMNLGRTLREEGITPRMIKKNQNLLIRAMKDTLCNKASPSGSLN